MNKRAWIIAGSAVVLVVAGAYAIWAYTRPHVLQFPGVVEIQEVRLTSKVGGRIENLLVKEGESIDSSRTTPLAVFEAPELRNQHKQMRTRLAQAEEELKRTLAGARVEEIAMAKATRDVAKARWDRAEKGWREEEIDQAESEYKSAQADIDQAMKDFVRIAGLYNQGSTSRTEYDAAIAYRDRAKGRADGASFKMKMMKVGSREEDKREAKAEFEKADANYLMLKNGNRDEDKNIARAKVEQLRAELEAIEINLKETEVRVPPNLGKATIEVIAFRPGDVVPANQPVMRVLRVQDLWVKIFVPETQYGLVRLDQKVDVTIDSYPGKIFKGKVIQRANISEFTPRNVQSVDERRHQVFAVKVEVEDAHGVFNAGMAAEVTIRVD